MDNYGLAIDEIGGCKCSLNSHNSRINLLPFNLYLNFSNNQVQNYSLAGNMWLNFNTSILLKFNWWIQQSIERGHCSFVQICKHQSNNNLKSKNRILTLFNYGLTMSIWHVTRFICKRLIKICNRIEYLII